MDNDNLVLELRHLRDAVTKLSAQLEAQKELGHEGRIRSLELAQAKMIGAASVGGSISGGIVALISWLVSH